MERKKFGGWIHQLNKMRKKQKIWRKKSRVIKWKMKRWNRMTSGDQINGQKIQEQQVRIRFECFPNAQDLKMLM